MAELFVPASARMTVDADSNGRGRCGSGGCSPPMRSTERARQCSFGMLLPGDDCQRVGQE